MFGHVNFESSPFIASSEPTKFEEFTFCETLDGITVACEGVILNAKEVAKEQETLAQAIVRLYQTDENALFNAFEGEFAIAIFDLAHEHRHLVFNDRLSKKYVFYYLEGDKLAFSTSFFDLISFLKRRNVNVHPDIIGLSMMRYYGVFAHTYTYFEEVTWLGPYAYIELGNGSTQLKSYATKMRYDLSPDVSKLHALFCKGLGLQAALNDNHGYKQIYSISGGMDSRAVLNVGTRLGYKPSFTFTYAESGSLDQQIAAKVAAEEHVSNYFFALDGGTFLLKRDEIVPLNEGQMLYSGTTGAYDVSQTMDVENVGIVHTGVGGGEIFGDQCGHLEESDARFEGYVAGLHLDAEHSNALLKQLHEAYDNYNQFITLVDIRKCLNFCKTTHTRFVGFSPFLYEPLFEYLMQVDYEQKHFRKFYLSWYREKIKSRITSTSALGGFGSSPVSRARKVLKLTQMRLYAILEKRLRIKSKFQMNPFDYWYSTNEDIPRYLKECEQEDMQELSRLHLDPIVMDIVYANETTPIIPRLCAMTARKTLILCDRA